MQYLWRFTPGVERHGEEFVSFDEFVAYVKDIKAAPLRITFRTWSDPVWGGPLRSGARIDLDDPESAVHNLHTPGAARLLILAARKRGWHPESGESLVIEDGLPLLSETAEAVHE